MAKTQILKWFRILNYAAVTLVPLVFFKFSMFPFGIPKIFLSEILIELMAALWLGLMFLDKKAHPRSNPILWAIAAFAFVLILSGLLGGDVLRSFWSTIDRTMGIVGILHYLVYAIMLSAMGRELDWRKIFEVGFYSSILVALSVFLSKWGMWAFFLRQNPSRPGGLYGNALFVGQLLLFQVFIGLWLWRSEKLISKKWVFIAGTLVNVAAIFLTQTIGIILALVFGLALLAFYFAFKEAGKVRKMAIGVLILGGLFILTMFLSRDARIWQKVPGFARVASISLEQSDVKDRLLAWQTAWEGFKERPVLGWGWENANIPFNKHYDPRLLITTIEGTFFDKPHNVYLEQLVTGGALGLLTYLGLFIAAGLGLWQSKRKGGDFAPFFAVAFAAYLLQNAIAFDTIATYPTIALMLGFIAHEAYGEKEEAVEAAGVPGWRAYAAPVFLVVALMPVWYNLNTLRAANRYYWGINYFLNGLPESSDMAWHKALALRSPYVDYIRKDYASIIMQGFQQNVRLPHFDERQREGADLMEKIVERHPQDYFFHVASADYYVTLSPFDKDYLNKADEHLGRALELSPRRQQIYYVMARRDLVGGNKDKALADFRQAIALNPEAGDPHFVYGLLLYALGDPAKGKSEISKAAELGRKPKSMDEAIRLASFEADMDHDYQSAIENLKIALDLSGALPSTGQKVVEIRFKLGVAYYLSGHTEEAKQELQFIADSVNVRELPNWEALKPALDELGVKYK